MVLLTPESSKKLRETPFIWTGNTIRLLINSKEKVLFVTPSGNSKLDCEDTEKGQKQENINTITTKDCFMGVAINLVFYFDFNLIRKKILQKKQNIDYIQQKTFQ